MSWFSNLFPKKLPLTTTDRQTIWRLFGSFHANKLGSNPQKLIQQGFEENIDVYSVFTKTYEVFNSIPQIVERRTPDGWEIEENTTIHDLWANPNSEKGYTWNDINTQRMIYLLCTGSSYMVGQEGLTGNTILEVDVLPSQSVTITTGQDFFMPNPKYQFQLGQQTRNFDKDELQQIKLFNPAYCSVQESQYGLSVIQVAARAVRTGNDKWDAQASLFQNRGAIGFVTGKNPPAGGRPMDAKEAEAVQKAFNERAAGADKFGRTLVTNKDMEFHQMAMSSTDLELVKNGEITLRAICNVMGYDSSLFNDPANKTYNNRLEAEKAMYTNVMMPLTEMFDAQDTRFIAWNHYPDRSRRIRHDFSKIEALQKDKKAEAEKDKIRMDGINVVLNMPISSEGKRSLLMSDYEMTEEQAKEIVTDEQGL